MKLNPIKNATIQGVEEFTSVIANFSSVLIDPRLALTWKIVQKVILIFVFWLKPVVSSLSSVRCAVVVCKRVSDFWSIIYR